MSMCFILCRVIFFLKCIVKSDIYNVYNIIYSYFVSFHFRSVKHFAASDIWVHHATSAILGMLNIGQAILKGTAVEFVLRLLCANFAMMGTTQKQNIAVIAKVRCDN
jgi:hypothetical protein